MQSRRWAEENMGRICFWWKVPAFWTHCQDPLPSAMLLEAGDEFGVINVTNLWKAVLYFFSLLCENNGIISCFLLFSSLRPAARWHCPHSFIVPANRAVPAPAAPAISFTNDVRSCFKSDRTVGGLCVTLSLVVGAYSTSGKTLSASLVWIPCSHDQEFCEILSFCIRASWLCWSLSRIVFLVQGWPIWVIQRSGKVITQTTASRVLLATLPLAMFTSVVWELAPDVVLQLLSYLIIGYDCWSWWNLQPSIWRLSFCHSNIDCWEFQWHLSFLKSF